MKCIFSHGRLGKPDGQKIRLLSSVALQHNFQVESIDYTDTLDPDVRAERLSEIVKMQTVPFCLIGSSMGGYATLIAAELADRQLLQGLFLMAPALYLPRYQRKQFATGLPSVEIIHGWHDDVVLYEHSVRYAKDANCTLHLLDDNHQLSQSPQVISRLFADFLCRIESSNKT